MSLLAIDLAPPACLRRDAPLHPFDPLLALPALPRNSDCTLFIIPFFLLSLPLIPQVARIAAPLWSCYLARHHTKPFQARGLRYTDNKRADR